MSWVLTLPGSHRNGCMCIASHQAVVPGAVLQPKHVTCARRHAQSSLRPGLAADVHKTTSLDLSHAMLLRQIARASAAPPAVFECLRHPAKGRGERMRTRPLDLRMIRQE
eukprot:1181288-Amphidinium_carterae.2